MVLSFAYYLFSGSLSLLYLLVLAIETTRTHVLFSLPTCWILIYSLKHSGCFFLLIKTKQKLDHWNRNGLPNRFYLTLRKTWMNTIDFLALFARHSKKTKQKTGHGMPGCFFLPFFFTISHLVFCQLSSPALSKCIILGDLWNFRSS